MKPLKIKTGVVRRTAKDYVHYEEEARQNQQKLQEMKVRWEGEGREGR